MRREDVKTIKDLMEYSLEREKKLAHSMEELMEAKPGDGVITDTIIDFAESKETYWQYWERKKRERDAQRGEL